MTASAPARQAAQIAVTLLLMLPSLSLPRSSAVRNEPIQAEKLPPDRKVLGQQRGDTSVWPATGRLRECNKALLVSLSGCRP